MTGSRQPWPLLRAVDTGRRAWPPVDELIQNRHKSAVVGGVESPSRAAGGFPTLGGGARSLSLAGGAASGTVASGVGSITQGGSLRARFRAGISQPVAATPPDVATAGGGKG
jgi:hypothetical protein